MLNNNCDGSIRLTIKGFEIARIDGIIAQELTARQLVQWENDMRLEHYNRNNGFYSLQNQRKTREAQTSDSRRIAYPNASVEPLDIFNAYWEQHRHEAIDL